MNVTFACPNCREPNRAFIECDDAPLKCAHCQESSAVPKDAWIGPKLRKCLVCHCDDLFTRKDFPQRLGVALVVIGFVGFVVAHYYYMVALAYGFLLGTAAIDLLLYLCVGEALVCYRCDAHYRVLDEAGGHGGFDLETHERYRQIAARQKQAGIEASAPVVDSTADASGVGSPEADMPKVEVPKMEVPEADSPKDAKEVASGD